MPKIVNICLKLQSRVVDEIRSTRIKHYNCFSFDPQSDMRMLSTGIRSIINIKSQNFCNISQLVQNGKTVQNPKDTATIFNQYFLNIGSKID